MDDQSLAFLFSIFIFIFLTPKFFFAKKFRSNVNLTNFGNFLKENHQFCLYHKIEKENTGSWLVGFFSTFLKVYWSSSMNS
jgi:hypothetical protein